MMPPSISEHPDVMWFIIIGLVNVLGALGTIIVAILSFIHRRDMKLASQDQAELKSGQIIILDKLDKQIERLHQKVDDVKKEVVDKIDTVKADVDQLKGEHRVYHRIGIKNSALLEKEMSP